ncbi:MAG TPA: HD domain-containing phosphohydrolase [Nitrospirota bacterium]|nr:HD domain-containing phosphohydrolase [Nitrospirota bacterium]
MAEKKNDSRGESRQSFFARQLLLGTAKTSFQQLSGLMKNVTIYPESHPFLLALAEKLIGTLQGLLVGRKEVAFYLVSGELFFETHSVPLDQSVSLLVEQFTSRDIGAIVFKPELTTAELIRLAVLMSKEPETLKAEGGVLQIALRENITHIELHHVLLVDKKTGGAIKEEQKKSAQLFMDAIDAIKDVVKSVHRDKSISMRRLNTVVQTMVDNVLENRDALMGLTSLKMYDEYTFAHSVNTAILAISLGTFLSFEKPQIAALGAAAMLHDIGKVRVPHEIINKPGKLTDEEWQAVRRHPISGALIATGIPGVTKLAMVVAFEHHQHGTSGYPHVENHSHEHLFSNIVSLADSYEALTAARVYYSVQMPPDQAIRILVKKRGTVFHPVLVKAFVNMIGIFPIGTVLKLSSGEVGLVLHQTRDLMRPRVLLLTKFDGSERGSGAEISLLETTGGNYKRDVVGIIDPYTSNINVKQYLE